MVVRLHRKCWHLHFALIFFSSAYVALHLVLLSLRDTPLCHCFNVLKSQHQMIFCGLWSVAQRSQDHWSIKIGGRHCASIFIHPQYFMKTPVHASSEAWWRNVVFDLCCASNVTVLLRRKKNWRSFCFTGKKKKNKVFLCTLTQVLGQGKTDFMRGPDEGFTIRFHIRRQVAGWAAEQWGDGETCSGKHVGGDVNFLHLPHGMMVVTTGTLSAVGAAGGKPREQTKPRMWIKRQRGQRDRADSEICLL